MSGQLSLDKALAIIDSAVEIMKPSTPGKEIIETWQKRFKCQEPILTQDEFPVQMAAELLAEIMRHHRKISFLLEHSFEFIRAYLSSQKPTIDWNNYSLNRQYGDMLVHLSCQSALIHKAGIILQHLDITDWSKNKCPICASKAGFAILENGQGIRNLVCGTCITRWRYKRIGCAYCNEEYSHKLKVFSCDEFPGWVVTACLTCRGYLKTANLRKLAAMPKWERAAIETLPLDYAVISWLDKN